MDKCKYTYKCLVFLLIVIALILLNMYYYNFLNRHFIKNGTMVYDYFLECIHSVSKKNYYMNYGLWTNKNTTLIKANKNLCNFIYKKGRMNNSETFTILDVGCGYGAQDFQWIKKISSKSSIVAVDISRKQIDYANRKLSHKHISKKRLKFIEGDADKLLDKFNKNQVFNRIISLETAFHYNNRPLFFKNVSKLLTDDGIFVISDIILNNNITYFSLNHIFIKLASDFFCIPKTNLITLNEWKHSIERNGLNIIECYDITDQTFVPYYSYFFKTYIKNKNLPHFISTCLINIFNNNNPFSYVVAVCKRNL